MLRLAKILKTLLYVLKRSHNLKVGTDEPKGLYLPGEIIPYSDHDKLDKIFAFADVEEILDSEFKSRHGKMVVSGKTFLPLRIFLTVLQSAQTILWPTKFAKQFRKTWTPVYVLCS